MDIELQAAVCIRAEKQTTKASFSFYCNIHLFYFELWIQQFALNFE